MKLKIVKVQKVSEIQTKSGFHGSNEASTDADGRARPVHPPTQETTWTTDGNFGLSKRIWTSKPFNQGSLDRPY